ncbi:hypothetical protein B296_00050429 [Ensete ventricosum]|uniref:Uncharacterized protein n=1 Tax=Ensete ventricosum TaxID=4639 RepID=A0A426Y3F6_ENSVE|nr:hypothetical protein B296_00050429 [Ensete ventricosum]
MGLSRRNPSIIPSKKCLRCIDVGDALDQMGGTLGFGSGSRLLEWWSTGRAEVFQLGSAVDSCKKVGSGAYIVGVVGRPYLATWLPLWLTMLSHTSTITVVLAVGHASASKGVDLTCVKPTVRPLAPPYLRPASFPHRVGHVGGPVVRGRADVATGSPSAISFFPLGKTFSRCPMRRELENWNGAGADPTERELRNLNSAGADPTEQELENLNSAGADPTEQELGNLNGAEADPTERELGN